MSNQGNSILALFVGGAIGLTIGILFAPDKGQNTRKKVLDEALMAKNEFSEKINEAMENIDVISEKKGSLEDQLDSILTDVSYKADDIILKLEKKLAQLKERNKVYQEKQKNTNEETA